MAEPAEHDHHAPLDANAWFFKNTSLKDLVRDAEPLTSMEELALPDLTPDEADSFLCSVKE